VVDADGEHLGFAFDKLGVITSQGSELVGSTGAEVEDVKRQQYVLAAAKR
jgi:hypothetical protein